MSCRVCGNPEAQCCETPAWVSRETFRDAWVRRFGSAGSDAERRFLDVGIDDFREDYLSGSPQALQTYFDCISA